MLRTQTTQRHAIVAAIAFALFVLAALHAPHADAFGGLDAVGQAVPGGGGVRPGGGGIPLDCPAGQFVVGFTGRSGAWIDALGVMCAPLNGTGFGGFAVAKELPMQGKLDGGAGFPGLAIMCPVGRAVDWMTWNMTRDPDGGHVDNIEFYCRFPEADGATFDTKAEIHIYSDEPGDFHIGGDEEEYTAECGFEQGFATGIHIRASDSVEGLDLDCGSINIGSTSSPLTADAPIPPAADDGMNRPGNDISSSDLATADPALCEQSCTGNGQCQAWTYVKPGVQGPAARCWLKSPAPATHPDPCCISGLRLPSDAKSGENMPGSDISGADLASADPNLCASSCQANRDCQAWTYVKPGVQGPAARCWLKNARPPIVSDPCCVSGVTDHLSAAAARKVIEALPLCPAGWNLVVDPSLLPANYERQTVTLNGSSILCARRRLSASDVIKLIPPPCQPLMHHDADGQCVRNPLIVPNDTAPHQPTAPKAGPVCPAGWQKVDDPSHLSRDWVTQTLSMGGITITCAKFRIELHPSQAPETSGPCDKNQLRLKDGSCPKPPPQLLPQTPLPTINLHNAQKVLACPDGQPRDANDNCPPPKPNIRIKPFLLNNNQPNNGLH